MENPLIVLATAIMNPIRQFLIRGILVATLVILGILLVIFAGCGMVRTKVQWDIEDRKGTGWIQGPGSATAKIVKPDGTKIEVEIERPPLWSANLPQVIDLGGTN